MSNTLRLQLVSDGVMLSDGGGAFGLVPRPRWAKLLPPDEQNRVPLALWTPLIEVDGRRILIDAGIGNKHPGVYETRAPHITLLQDLAARGVQPEDIDILIFTHLHGDHAGWATQRGDAGDLRATFPNAVHYVQRIEYSDATHTNERTRNTYFGENVVPLFEQGRLILLDGEAQITPSVRVIPAPGHTAGHQVVVISSPDTTTRPVFYVGELATFAIQFVRLPWVTAYDVLPMLSIESKRHWQARALAENAVVIGSHELGMPVWRMVKTEKGFIDAVPTDDPRIVR